MSKVGIVTTVPPLTREVEFRIEVHCLKQRMWQRKTLVFRLVSGTTPNATRVFAFILTSLRSPLSP